MQNIKQNLETIPKFFIDLSFLQEAVLHTYSQAYSSSCQKQKIL